MSKREKEIKDFTKNVSDVSDEEMRVINEQHRIRSQTNQIPYELNLDRHKIISAWTEENILKDSNNSDQNNGEPTMTITILNKAAEIILDFFKKDDYFKFKILDIMSGNLASSSIMFIYFISHFGKESNNKIGQWILTDVVEYRESIMYEILKKTIPDGSVKIPFFIKMNTVDAVKKYGVESNILLLISPYPSSDGYGDYFACKDFIDQTREGEKKYIIFVGELGEGDGTSGMYSYLMNNPFLIRKVKQEIHNEEKGRFRVIKEVFIFLINKNKNLCNMCGVITQTKCRCGTHYCCREHQIYDRENHKSSCEEKIEKEKNIIEKEKNIKEKEKKINLGISLSLDDLKNLRNDLNVTGKLNVEIEDGIRKRKKSKRKKSKRKSKGKSKGKIKKNWGRLAF